MPMAVNLSMTYCTGRLARMITVIRDTANVVV